MTQETCLSLNGDSQTTWVVTLWWLPKGLKPRLGLTPCFQPMGPDPWEPRCQLEACSPLPRMVNIPPVCAREGRMADNLIPGINLLDPHFKNLCQMDVLPGRYPNSSPVQGVAPTGSRQRTTKPYCASTSGDRAWERNCGLCACAQTAQEYFYICDGRGNVVSVVDSRQQGLASYQYSPFAVWWSSPER